MSNTNSLAGLVANYGDSEEESDGSEVKHVLVPPVPGFAPPSAHDMAMRQPHAPIHPAPIAHCPWSACYDESSGFTYYWNQLTNAVTWEAPPEYLLALKLAQQQLHSTGIAEVSAKDWQLYQQALLEKQKAPKIKPIVEQGNKIAFTTGGQESHSGKKRSASVDEEKIELITSYYNSDSESNDESEGPLKVLSPSIPQTPPATKVAKNPHKKQKTKPSEYGPPLPPDQEYTAPIGPELPPNLVEQELPKTPERKGENAVSSAAEDKKSSKLVENEDSQDEITLFQRLKDKAKLLEKLGGELPTELQKIIDDENNSTTASPKSQENRLQHNLDIDELLEEIEKTELPKIKSKKGEKESKTQISNSSSIANSPLPPGDKTPPLEEITTLFPSSKAITEESTALFPSAVNIEQQLPVSMEVEASEKKSENTTTANNIEADSVSKKKNRIPSSMLPEWEKSAKFDATAYTTKYSQYMEGFAGERVGLGFRKEVNEDACPKNTISYGNGLTFTKGEILNEDKKDEDLDDLVDLVEAKMKYLNQLQPCIVTPVQEMLIQLQTLVAAFRAGALSTSYWRRWIEAGARTLRAHEASAAPAGWSCAFLRSEGRYRYRREADGLEQWEYPAVGNTDMDISTTPPHPGVDHKEDQPPLPPSEPPPPPQPPLPPPPQWSRVPTPPPPAWIDPPPPGIDEPPPLPPEPKKEIGDELLSFYNDIAELEKNSEPMSPEPPPPPLISERERTTERSREKDRDRERERDKNKEKEKANKKKSKVKISSSIGMKHKSVSSMVAKWQQVANEIDSE